MPSYYTSMFCKLSWAWAWHGCEGHSPAMVIVVAAPTAPHRPSPPRRWRRRPRDTQRWLPEQFQCGKARLSDVLLWASCCLATLCQMFTGISPEFHQNSPDFTGISPEIYQNIELERLKKEDNLNSAFPQITSYQ